jgi:hypothetical protein
MSKSFSFENLVLAFFIKISKFILTSSLKIIFYITNKSYRHRNSLILSVILKIRITQKNKLSQDQRKYRVYSIEYRVKKEKKRYKKVEFFFLSNYPTKVYTNEQLAE